MDNDISEVIDQLGDQFFEKNLEAIRHVYIDNECLQDFRIGALLCMIDSEDDYNHILDNVVEYNKRTCKSVMRYFPNIKITDEELEIFIKDEQNHIKLERASPTTIYYHGLIEFFNTIDNINEIALHKDPPTVHIGSSGIIYSHATKQCMCKCLQQLKPSWKFKMLDSSLYKLDMEFVKVLDHLTVWDHEKLFHGDHFRDVMQRAEAIVRRSVHAFPFFDQSIDFSDVSEEETIANTETVFGIFCDFKYINLGIVHE